MRSIFICHKLTITKADEENNLIQNCFQKNKTHKNNSKNIRELYSKNYKTLNKESKENTIK